MKPIDRAIEAAGGLTELARRVSELTGEPLSVQAVSKWRRRVPAERCADIERATGVTRAELRPDLFGDLGPTRRAKVA